MVTTAKRVEDGYVVERDTKSAVPMVPASLLKEARAKWDEFEGSLRGSLSKAIALGKSLLAIKEECGHGHFGRYFSDHDNPERDALPFAWSWANKLMRMAANDAISNSSHARNLPADLETIYELATMTAPALEAAIEAGKVTPQMTRAEAKALKKGVAADEDAKDLAGSAESQQQDNEPDVVFQRVMGDIAAIAGRFTKKYPEFRKMFAASLNTLARSL